MTLTSDTVIGSSKSAFCVKVDNLLRGNTGGLRPLLAFLCTFGMAYGAVMGTFGGVSLHRLEQVLYSAVKVPLLLGVTFVISLPSFFVLNTLAGLRNDFAEAVRAVAATQAGLTIILASLAPFTILWYVSSGHYHGAILFNAAMFGIASLSAQRLLGRLYAPLIARDARHRWLARGWLGIYAFVGIQFGWLLRPFVGDPMLPTQFLRPDAWSNAYVAMWDTIMGVMRGMDK